jgi:DNA-binding MarR family transcriptional regulator
MSISIVKKITENTLILTQIIQNICEKNYLQKSGQNALNRTQFTILKILSSNTSSSVSELADILHISRAAISKSIEILVNSNLVSRKIIEEDRRAVLIELLKAGHTVVKKYDELRLKNQERVLNNFTDKEKKQFAQLLDKYILLCLDQETDTELICLQCDGRIGEYCSIGKHRGSCYYYFKKNN